MEVSPLAQELNDSIIKSNPVVFDLMSSYGKRLFFPKGIVSQSLEAKEKASLFNATIGIAKEDQHAMMLNSLEDYISPNIKAHSILPYAPSSGVLELRKLWQEHQRKINPGLESMSLPVVTSGLTHALSLVGDLFLDEGDTVILPHMYWGNYRLMWQLKKGAHIKTYSLFDESLSGFNFDTFLDVLSSVESKKIFLSLNFPHNPTGYSPSFDETKKMLESLKKLAESGKQIIAVCDDAYWGLVYEEGHQKESFFSELSKLHPNLLAVKVDGCTKEFFMWGMRVGFLSFGSKGLSNDAYLALEKKTASAIRGEISNVTHHSQELLKKLLKKDEVYSECEEKYGILMKRYQEVKNIVFTSEFSDFWDVYPFNSGYFMCLRLKNNLDPEKLRLHLLDQYKIGIISLTGNDIRVAFSCVEKEDLPKLFTHIAKAIKDLI